MKMNENNEGPYIRANEVQKMLKVGRNTVYEWCKKRKYPTSVSTELSFFRENVFRNGLKITRGKEMRYERNCHNKRKKILPCIRYRS